jgi:two-component system, NarL family, nitrate/nitrite response regulator NarL
MTMLPVRLLLAADHTLFRRGLVALLAGDASVCVAGEAADMVAAVRQARDLQPDLVLLDNHLPGATGIQALAELREAAPQARLVLLTVREDEQDLQAALRAGANGFLLKTIDGDVLIQAIHRVMRGEPVISPQLMTRLLAALQGAGGWTFPAIAAVPAPQPDGRAHLSPREQEVLEEITLGSSNKQIARTLQIAEPTVKIHVQHILRKLRVTSRVQAAVRASSSGHNRF